MENKRIICFLGPANNYHIIKWCGYFVSKNYDVHVVSFTKSIIDNCIVHYIDTGVSANDMEKNKIKYLFFAKKVKKMINKINPDIISVHYSSSYGSVAAFSGIKNYFLSIWGSDVYDFPNHGLLQKMLTKYSLKKAKYLLSTSKVMAIEASKYTKKKFYITPFGVKMDLFNPAKRKRDDNLFVIGNIKALSCKYGIDVLLRASSIIHIEHPEINLSVRIAGRGEDEVLLKKMADDLGLHNIVCWLGFISQEEAAKEWANMDVAVVSSSSSESFGVSAVEAEASGIPVIITDVPGLMEATKPGYTSIVVPRKNDRALADAIYKLFLNKNLRIQMGNAGVQFVKENYEYNYCFGNIENIFISNIKSR